MSSSPQLLFDGPSRVAVLLGLFNPEVDGHQRVCEVVVGSHDSTPTNKTITCMVVAISTPDLAMPMRPTLWLQCLDGSQRLLRVDRYDLHRRNGEVRFCNAPPWERVKWSAGVALSHSLDQIDLLNQFCWREGQRHPLWVRVEGLRADSILPAHGVDEMDGHRVALFLRTAQRVLLYPHRFCVEAEDLGGKLWHGQIDIARKVGDLSQGSFRMVDDAPTAYADDTPPAAVSDDATKV